MSSADPFSALLARAEALAAMDRQRDAIPLLAQALALQPRDLRATCRMALCFIELKDPKQALQLIDTVLDSGDDWPFRLRALALIRLKRPNEAVAAAGEALRIAPNLFLTHLMLSHALLAQRKFRDALAAAEAALRLAPNSRDSNHARASALLGLGRLKEAERAFRATIALAPDWYAAHNDLGIALLRQRKPIAAAQAFLQALRLSPAEGVALRNIDVVLAPYRRMLFLAAGVLLFFAVAPSTSTGTAVFWLIPAMVVAGIGGVVTWRARRVIPPEVRRALARQRRWTFRRVYGLFVLVFVTLVIAVALIAPDPPPHLEEQATAKAAELRRCVPSSFHSPSPTLKVTVRVLPRGQVDRITLDPRLPSSVQRCLSDRIHRWRFARAPVEASEVQFALPLR